MSKKVKMSKQEKLLNVLKSGKSVTFNQVKSTYGLANPSDTVKQLRMKGYMVYSNKVTLSDGRMTTSYRIGEPSQEFIAAAFRAQYAS